MTADLVLAEVLRGFADEREREIAQDALLRFPVYALGGTDLALKAARNGRVLVAKGLPPPDVVLCLLGTFCAEHHFVLLHDDPGFEPFEKHLGLIAPAREE
jgi:predicted nucleic acid-binding protein